MSNSRELVSSPASGQAGQLVDDEFIDAQCDRFEVALRSGKATNIAQVLTAAPERLRGQLLRELVLVDYEYRSFQGDDTPRDYYMKRHTAYASVIDSIDFSAPSEVLASIASLDPSKVGPLLDRFEMIGRLGVGGMGQVWKARDTTLDRVVAVKVPRSAALRPFERRRFLREGRAAAKLRHSNIVRVFEVSQDEARPYIVSEFIPGLNLRDYVRQHKPTLECVVGLLIDTADAVHHAHAAGVVHRDVKPGNVLIDRNGVPHVTDFGLAKMRSHDLTATPSVQVMGTPAYMAPEMARGKAASADARTDVYSLGVMLYELTTGKLPFPGNDLSSVLHAILSKEPRQPRSICSTMPRDLETICLKAMAKEPSRRYQSASEFAADLRRFQRSESISARPATAAEKSLRLASRRPAAVAAAILAMVAVTASMAAVGITADRDEIVQENERLRGLRTVRLTTEPAGAQVAFTRLNPANGAPIPEEFRSLGPSPIEQKFGPGRYLVVSWISDELFHEVVRYVPGDDDPMPGSRAQHYWHVAEDGAIELEPIHLWNSSSEGIPAMAMVGLDGPAKANGLTFFSEAQLTNTTEALRRIPLHNCKSSERPAMLTYDQALIVAEKSGCRLPTIAELRASLSSVTITKSGQCIWSNQYANFHPNEAVIASYSGTGTKHLVLDKGLIKLPMAVDRHDQCSLLRVRSRWPRNTVQRLSESVSCLGGLAFDSY